MQEPTVRFSPLETEAGAALKAMTRFEKLSDGHVGQETLVRGRVVPCGCAADLSAWVAPLQCRGASPQIHCRVGDGDGSSWLEMGPHGDS